MKLENIYENMIKENYTPKAEVLTESSKIKSLVQAIGPEKSAIKLLDIALYNIGGDGIDAHVDSDDYPSIIEDLTSLLNFGNYDQAIEDAKSYAMRLNTMDDITDDI